MAQIENLGGHVPPVPTPMMEAEDKASEGYRSLEMGMSLGGLELRMEL